MLFAPIAAQSIATPKRASLMVSAIATAIWIRTNDRPNLFRNDGLSESDAMTRNEQLKADKDAGHSVAYICAFHKISKSRLYQILNPEGYKGQQQRAKEKKNEQR